MGDKPLSDPVSDITPASPRPKRKGRAPQFVQAFPVHELIPYAGNARKHRDDIPQLVKSIQYFGWTNPVLAQYDTKIVLAGHGRIEAAKQAGLHKVPVLFLDLSDVDAKAYRLTDNRQAEKSSWWMPTLHEELRALNELGYDLELTGFSDADISEREMHQDMNDEAFAEKFVILVECQNEQDQLMRLQQFLEMGLSCRAMNA